MEMLNKILAAVKYTAIRSYNFLFGSIIAVAKNKANAHDVLGAAMRFAAALVAVFGLTGAVATAVTTYMTIAFYLFAFRTALGVMSIITEGKCKKFKFGVFFNEKTYSYTV